MYVMGCMLLYQAVVTTFSDCLILVFHLREYNRYSDQDSAVVALLLPALYLSSVTDPFSTV